MSPKIIPRAIKRPAIETFERVVVIVEDVCKLSQSWYRLLASMSFLVEGRTIHIAQFSMQNNEIFSDILLVISTEFHLLKNIRASEKVSGNSSALTSDQRVVEWQSNHSYPYHRNV